MEITTLLIIQARFSSTRLPGKVLKKVENKTLLHVLLHRLSKCRNVDQIVIATSTNEKDLKVVEEIERLGHSYYRGSENNVLDRYYQAALAYRPKWVVRVTSDCPLIDPLLIDNVISFTQNKQVDYGSNVLRECYPDGQDVEVFSFEALEKAWKEAKLDSEREHVTAYITDNSSFFNKTKFTSANYPCPKDYSQIRMTVDEQADFNLIKKLIEDIGIDRSWEEYAEYMIKNNLTELNSFIKRNEGYVKSTQTDN